MNKFIQGYLNTPDDVMVQPEPRVPSGRGPAGQTLTEETMRWVEGETVVFSRYVVVITYRNPVSFLFSFFLFKNFFFF